MTENNTNNINIADNNIHLPLTTTCEQCQFMQSCKLSQQIVQLRQKLAFYQTKNKQIQQFINKSQQQQSDVLKQYENTLSKQMENNNYEQMQISKLEKQLHQLEQQVSTQRQLQKRDKLHENELIRGFDDVQDERFQIEKEEKELLQQLNRSKWKQVELKSVQSILQRTNFINVIYSINFQDANSFLNGEKITPENSWKIIQILAFYQQKYPSYDPAVKINWNSMQILPNIMKIKQPSYFDSIIFNPIQICCDSASTVLNTWMQFIIVEMKNLFQFLVKESGLNSKLKYEVTKDGQFEVVKNRAFKSQMQKFNLIVKCLLIDIDQINKLEFFAKEKRINQAEQKE